MGAFLFLRYFVPAIAVPSEFGILKSIFHFLCDSKLISISFSQRFRVALCQGSWCLFANWFKLCQTDWLWRAKKISCYLWRALWKTIFLLLMLFTRRLRFVCLLWLNQRCSGQFLSVISWLQWSSWWDLWCLNFGYFVYLGQVHQVWQKSSEETQEGCWDWEAWGPSSIHAFSFKCGFPHKYWVFFKWWNWFSTQDNNCTAFTFKLWYHIKYFNIIVVKYFIWKHMVVSFFKQDKTCSKDLKIELKSSSS